MKMNKTLMAIAISSCFALSSFNVGAAADNPPTINCSWASNCSSNDSYTDDHSININPTSNPTNIQGQKLTGTQSLENVGNATSTVENSVGQGQSNDNSGNSNLRNIGNTKVGDIKGIDGDINASNEQGQGQEQSNTNRVNNTNDNASNAAQKQGIDRSGNSNNRNAAASNQGQSSKNTNDSVAKGNITSFTDNTKTVNKYKSITIVPPALPGTPPSMVGNGQVVSSISACGPLMAVVSRDVRGMFYGIISDTDVNLGETDRLVPVTHNGERVLYWGRINEDGSISRIGSQVMTWAVPVNVAGARQFGLGGGFEGGHGQVSTGTSSAMNQLVVHHEVVACDAGTIRVEPSVVTHIAQ